jgi:hypothetical protein
MLVYGAGCRFTIVRLRIVSYYDFPSVCESYLSCVTAMGPPRRFNKYGPKKGEVVYSEVNEKEEIESLKRRVVDEAPEPGSQLRR